MRNKIILGTVQFGLPYGINNSIGQLNQEAVFEILNYSHENNISTLDTANAYGTATQVIGNFHKQYKKHFQVNSKFHVSEGNLSNSVESELKQMDIDSFHVYSFHSFKDFKSCSQQMKMQLRALKKEERIHKIGLSVYGNEQFSEAIESDLIDVIQFPYNLLDNDYQRGEFIERAKKSGKELHVRSVFLQGLFFMNENEVPTKLEALKPNLAEIKYIAQKGQMSVYDLALGYALSNPDIDKVLIGIDSLDQLRKNIESLDKTENWNKEAFLKVNNIRIEDIELLNPVNWK